MLTAKDLNQLDAKGICVDVIEKQLEYFRNGFPFLQLDRAATVGDGIYRFAPDKTNELEHLFEEGIGQLTISKFVPASGAATRMFKELYEYMQSADAKESNAIKEIFNRLPDFAFYDELGRIMQAQQIAVTDKKRIAAAILLPAGLNYGNLPKGMLLFHNYADGSRTALEEHLVEGAAYARNADNTVNLHFTVSPEHQKGFENLVDSKTGIYAELFGVRYNISFSQQKHSTDTVAVDCNNIPIRGGDGNLLFRPGGHGALLENLNDLQGDIIFIKNIDNVVPDKLKPTTIQYKKILAGLSMHLQKSIFAYIRTLREKQSAEIIQEVKTFLSEQLSFRLPVVFSTWPADRQREYLLNILNRPVRVCGMVKNEGEPGGGPFWVCNADGSASLQIVESSQIDMNNPQQKAMAAKATHFNPVDLVCAVNDCDGKHFNLLKYRDPDTGFISVKSKDGAELKAQELPGLWNGAMARWNTVFVEVPIDTFNPVKTVNDLLRPQHQ